MKNGDRILIEHSSGIGDLIVLTPILREIKQKYPDSVITVASSSENSLSAINRVDYIDAVLTLDKSPAGIYRLCKSLTKQDYVLFYPHHDVFFLFLARLCSVKHRITVYKHRHRKHKLATYLLPYCDVRNGQHKIDFFAEVINLALEENFSIKDYKCDVSYPNDIECNSVKKKLSNCGWSGNKYVVVSPYSSSSLGLRIKSIDCIVKFCISHQYDAVIMGGRNNGLDEWIKSNQSELAGKVYNICGETTLMEAVALIDDSACLITVDSGPMHIGAALNKATVAVFNAGKKWAWKPKNSVQEISLNLDCAAPCVNGIGNCLHEKCNDFSNEYLESKLDIAWQEYNL